MLKCPVLQNGKRTKKTTTSHYNHIAQNTNTAPKQNNYKSVIGIVVKEIKANKSKARMGRKKSKPARQMRKNPKWLCTDALTRSTKLIQ